MKFSDAQKRPESALVNVNHFWSALQTRNQQSAYNRKPTRRCMSAQIILSYSSSVCASSQAQSSTPVPPSLAPSHGRAPQLSASHLPRLNLRCNSRVPACWRICPSDRGKKRKLCASKAEREVLERKLKLARSDESGSGRRTSCSWYSAAAKAEKRREREREKRREKEICRRIVHHKPSIWSGGCLRNTLHNAANRRVKPRLGARILRGPR